MPQAVQTYVAKGDLLEVQRILDDLIIAIQADFVKYKRQIPPTNIKSVFESKSIPIVKLFYKFGCV